MANATGTGEIDSGATTLIVIAGITGLLFAVVLFRIISSIRYVKTSPGVNVRVNDTA